MLYESSPKSPPKKSKVFLLSFLGFPSAVNEEVDLYVCQAKNTAVVHILHYFGDHIIALFFSWLPDCMPALQIAKIHDFFFPFSVRPTDKEHTTPQASLKMHTPKKTLNTTAGQISLVTQFYVSEVPSQLGCKKRNIFMVV